jgi:hypothetical protein
MNRYLLGAIGLLLMAVCSVANAWTPVASEFDQSVVVKTYKTTNWRFGGGTTWDVRSRPAGEYRCTVAAWTNPPTSGINPRPGNGNYCEIEDATALQPVVPAAFEACYPAFTVSWPSLEIIGMSYVDVPASVESTSDRFYKSRDTCTGLITGQFSTPAERMDLRLAWARGDLDTPAEANAYAKSQPTRFLTVKEDAWRKAEIAASNAPPPAVPAPTCKITPQSATVLDRAVYKLNSAGTGVGSALTGVRVLQGTPCGLRLGSTNYYSVAGQKDTQGRAIAAGYAIGVVN